MPLNTRDLSNHGFWYPQGALEPIPNRYWELYSQQKKFCFTILREKEISQENFKQYFSEYYGGDFNILVGMIIGNKNSVCSNDSM